MTKFDRGSMRKFLVLGIAYTVTVLAFYFLDNFAEIAQGNRFLRGINPAALLFQKAVTSGFKKPRNNYVVLVLLDDKVPQATRDNLCLQRRYVAEVVDRISHACPAAIALDLTFSQETCPQTNPDLYQSTVELQRAIAAVPRTIPVVIAQRTIDATYMLKKSPQKLADLRDHHGFKDSEVILEPQVAFDSTDRNKVTLGLYTFNEDRRKVPLSWSAYSSLDTVGNEKPTAIDTFSVAVAKAFRPDPRIISQIRTFQDHDSHPLTSFLTQREILCFSAFDILAGGTHASLSQEKCRSTDTDTDPLEQINHRIVVIGKDDPRIDRWDSVIGEVPGAVLQANYIESILDSRLLKPVEGWLSVVAALAWLGLIEVIFRLWANNPHRAVLTAFLATAVVWVLLYDVALMQWGYYLVLWPPSIVAILWRYVLLLSERKRGHTGNARAERGQVEIKEATAND